MSLRTLLANGSVYSMSIFDKDNSAICENFNENCELKEASKKVIDTF